MQGVWEGRLKVTGSNLNKDSESYKQALAPYDDAPFRIEIRKRTVKVYFAGKEIKPGLFRIRTFMTNAVVTASDTGSDKDGRWVETWDLLLTQKNTNTLIVCFSRVVNNVEIPEEKEISKFFGMAAGELHRILQ
jgi:hypothetical protein